MRERYNPAGDRFRKVRSVFLELNDKCLKILRDMDKAGVDPQTIISNPDYLQLSEISSMIHSVFQMTNQIEDETEALPLPLDEVGEKLGEALDELADRLLGEQSNPAQKIADGPVYRLKITLKDSKPPIWHRVLVPSGIGLEQLQDVIQTVFGWHNCHLHQFIDGRTFYQPGGGNDDFASMMEVEDSK